MNCTISKLFWLLLAQLALAASAGSLSPTVADIRFGDIQVTKVYAGNGAGGEICWQKAAANWWDGLSLSSVWPMNEGSGNVLYDKVGGQNGKFTYGTWKTVGGVTALDFGSDTPNTSAKGAAWATDVYDLAKGIKLIYGGWYRPKWSFISETVNGLMGKGSSGAGGNYFLGYATTYGGYYSVFSVLSVGTAVRCSTNNIPVAWTHVAISLDRTTGKSTFWTNGILVSVTSYSDNGTAYNTTAPFSLFGISSNSVWYGNGSTRDVFVKVGGTTNDIPAIFNATKVVYGK